MFRAQGRSEWSKEKANKRRNTSSFPAAEEADTDWEHNRRTVPLLGTTHPKLPVSHCVAFATFERVPTQSKKGPRIPPSTTRHISWVCKIPLVWSKQRLVTARQLIWMISVLGFSQAQHTIPRVTAFFNLFCTNNKSASHCEFEP
jgi:hypothetical protein